MRSVLRRLMQATALALTLAAACVRAGPGRECGRTERFAAPAEPKADESNAVRGKTQPGNNAPFWRAVRDSGAQAGTTNLPGPEMGTLVQSFTQYPGLALHHGRRGLAPGAQPVDPALRRRVAADCRARGRPVPLAHRRYRRTRAGNTGRLIERFTYFERAAHWSVAISFVILAVSGLVMALGKFLLLPILGGDIVRLADLCAEDAAQLRRAGVRGRVADLHRRLPARQPAARRRPGLAVEGRRHARWRALCRRAASTPARRSSSGAA